MQCNAVQCNAMQCNTIQYYYFTCHSVFRFRDTEVFGDTDLTKIYSASGKPFELFFIDISRFRHTFESIEESIIPCPDSFWSISSPICSTFINPILPTVPQMEHSIIAKIAKKLGQK